MNKKYLILVLLAVASIVFAVLLIHYSEVGPIATGAYRLLGAIPLLLIIDYYTPKRTDYKINRRIMFLSSLAGLFFALDLIALNLSILHTTVAEAALLTNMVPFVIAPLSIILFKQRIPLKFLFTVVLAIIGLILLIGVTEISESHLRGDWQALLSTVFYAFYFICIKDVRESYYTSRVMIIICSVGGIAMFILASLRHEVLLPVSSFGWMILAGIVFFGMIAGQTLMTYAVKFIPIQLASLFLLMSPVFGAIFGYIFFTEKLVPAQLAGILVMMVAVYYGKLILERSSGTK